MKTYGTSRGLRNHNPGNVRPCKLPSVWLGQVGIDNAKGGPFSIYGDLGPHEADFWGIRACAHNFISYQRMDGCDTLGKIIARHAPASDNNDVAAYVAFVCGKLGVKSDVVVSLADDHGLMMKLLKQIFIEEDGSNPYPDSMIVAAIAAA